MGMRELESGILKELKVEANNNALRRKDILEWSTSEIKPESGETVYYLPMMMVYCAIKTTNI